MRLLLSRVRAFFQAVRGPYMITFRRGPIAGYTFGFGFGFGRPDVRLADRLPRNVTTHVVTLPMVTLQRITP